MTHRSLFIAGILVFALFSGVAIAADRSTLTPDQVYTEAATELSKVQSFQIDARGVDKDGESSFAGEVTSAGSMDVRYASKKQRFSIRKVGGRVFYKASASFWREEVDVGAAEAKRYANRWVRVPMNEKAARELVTGYRPQDVAHCMTRYHGTLSSGGVETYAGQPAIVVVDAADRPGTSPGKVYFAASGPARLLGVVQTGKTKPGGTADARCDSDDDDEPDTTISAELKFTYGERPAIVAPKNALTFRRGKASSHSYPAAEKRDFLAGCRRSGAAAGQRFTSAQIKRYCEAALSCLQERLSYERFVKMYERMASGKRNPDAKVLSTCVRIANEKVLGPKAL